MFVPERGKSTLKLENERLRITEWRFAPGEDTGWHRHEFDYVVVPMSTGQLDIVAPDGSVSQSELSAGEPYFRRAGVEHNVINSSGGDFAFIEIELF